MSEWCTLTYKRVVIETGKATLLCVWVCPYWACILYNMVSRIITWTSDDEKKRKIIHVIFDDKRHTRNYVHCVHTNLKQDTDHCLPFLSHFFYLFIYYSCFNFFLHKIILVWVYYKSGYFISLTITSTSKGIIISNGVVYNLQHKSLLFVLW